MDGQMEEQTEGWTDTLMMAKIRKALQCHAVACRNQWATLQRMSNTCPWKSI